MGRYYQTAKPTFVDENIYTPPWQLATQVLSNIDRDIEENEVAMGTLAGQLNAQGLQVDQPRVGEIITGYEGQIDELAKKLQENPLEFRKSSGAIRNLGKDIHENWTRGEIAAIQGNKGAYDTWLKNHLDKTKATKGYITQGDMEFAKKKFLSEFKGTQYKGPEDYQSLQTQDLNPYVNIEDVSEERGKGYLSSFTKNTNAYSKDGYIYKSEGSEELVEYDDIHKGVMSAMMNDTELMQYYGQQVQLGAMTVEQMYDRFSVAADRVAEKYSFNKKTQGLTSMTGDPFALKKVALDNAKKIHKFKKEYDNPEEISYTSRDAQSIDTEEFKRFMQTPTQSLKKTFVDASKKLTDFEKKGIKVTDPRYIKAKREADFAELQYLNKEQASIDREQDFLEQVKKDFGPKSKQYKTAKRLGWEAIYNIEKKTKTEQGTYIDADIHITTNPEEVELKEYHMKFRDQWAEKYAKSHAPTQWYIDIASGDTKDNKGKTVPGYYRDLGNKMLDGGKLEFLTPDGKALTDLEVDASWISDWGEDVSGNRVIEALMETLGTDDINKIFDMRAMRMEGNTSGTIKGFFTPEAKAVLEGLPIDEITIRVSGTNLPEIGYNHAKSKGHNVDEDGLAEDAWLPMSNPTYNNFANQIMNIPSQPEYIREGKKFADPDKSFGKIIATGDTKMKVINTGVDANGSPMYVIENPETGYSPKVGDNIKTYTLPEITQLMNDINTNYTKRVLSEQ